MLDTTLKCFKVWNKDQDNVVLVYHTNARAAKARAVAQVWTFSAMEWDRFQVERAPEWDHEYPPFKLATSNADLHWDLPYFWKEET